MTPSEQQHWSDIQAFAFETPEQEYGFSTRLASEQCWTLFFTQTAILEYRKFMFLTAVSDEMVSPSEVVDQVWHQHLIFTHSYAQFCGVLGKKVEHVPSTHMAQEREVFHRAQERTSRLYQQYFGEQPPAFWKGKSDKDALGLTPSAVDPRRVTAGIWLLLPLSMVVISALFQWVLIRMEAVPFLCVYVLLLVCSVGWFTKFVLYRLPVVCPRLFESQLVNNLDPLELIYLKYRNAENIIHGVFNELYRKGRFIVDKEDRLRLADTRLTTSPWENSIILSMTDRYPMTYDHWVKKNVNKPVFQQIVRSMDALEAYVKNSVEYQKLALLAHFPLLVILGAGICRAYLGISRGKDTGFLIVIMVVACVVILFNYSNYTNSIKNAFIRYHFRQKNPVFSDAGAWEWNYLFFPRETLVPAFLPLLSYVPTGHLTKSSDAGCGSSCGGGGCGGGCGGCGGGGD